MGVDECTNTMNRERNFDSIEKNRGPGNAMERRYVYNDVCM